MLSETTYEVQYVTGDGTLGRKSIVHRNRLKGVRSQAQKDILAETQQRQEAALAGKLGASDELDSDDGGKGIGGRQRNSHIWRAGGGSMWEDDQHANRSGVKGGTFAEAGEKDSAASESDWDRAKFYIGSDEEDNACKWTTVCRRKGRRSM